MADIIFVDDEKAIRFLMQTMLQKSNHTVRVTDNAAAALRMVMERKPDLLITDIYMPEKSGLELIMEVRKEYPDMNIIAVSGDSISRAGGHLEGLRLARSLGSSAVVEKPFTGPQIMNIINTVLKEGQPDED